MSLRKDLESLKPGGTVQGRTGKPQVAFRVDLAPILSPLRGPGIVYS